MILLDPSDPSDPSDLMFILALVLLVAAAICSWFEYRTDDRHPRNPYR